MDLVAALGSETALALSLVGVGCWELAWPEHRLDQNFGLRWTSNFALFAIALGLQIGLASSLPALVSVVFDQSPASRLSTVNSWAHLAYALLVLDAISYALHRISHSVPLLWRLHAAHHSDIAVDFTTTVRHHPGEAVFSAVAFGVSAAAAGCLPAEVACYAGLASLVQLIGHANIHVPKGLDRALSGILVTPAFHRIHHSSLRMETDSNYGEIFAFWDLLFGSFRKCGADPVEYGLEVCRETSAQRLDALLLLPANLGALQ